jgi:hypothetical protein
MTLASRLDQLLMAQLVAVQITFMFYVVNITAVSQGIARNLNCRLEPPKNQYGVASAMSLVVAFC